MRTIGAALLVVALVASNTFAAANSAIPLPNGKPAGLKEAAFLGPSATMVLFGVAIVATGLALSISNNGSDGVTSPTTSSTVGLP